MASRPQLLFLCQTLPYPPDGGVWIRTYHVLRLLARAFDVTALCFERTVTRGDGTGHDLAANCAALGRFASVEVFPVPQAHSRARYMWDHLRSAALGRAYTGYLYESRTYRARLEELLRSKRFDLVHVDSLDLFRYLPACHDLPVVCVHHNVESDLLLRRAAIERVAWRRAYLWYQARLTGQVERRWCPRVSVNVVVSEQDRALLKRLAPDALVSMVPNGVDLEEFQSDGKQGTGIGFVGGMHWFPNRDALEFFAAEIWPEVRARGDVPARWVGAATPEQQRSYREHHGIELTGYVEDVRPFMRDAACHVVPLRAGGGTRLKVLNSWAMGKAVVSTSIGCEGLAAVDGENILIRDDPKKFADAILSVLHDDVLRRRLGTGGRATVERLYSWDVIGEGLIDTYLALANVSCRSSATSGPSIGPVPDSDDAARPAAAPPQ